MKARYTKREFGKLDPTFKIEAIISDGMWYTTTKWRKFASVSEEELNEWIDEALEDGRLIRSETGQSYRMPLEEVEKWYSDNRLDITEPLLDFVFAPRIWDGMTEVEGFLGAPRRDVGVVTFRCSARAKNEIEARLRGVAVVRDENARESKYKAYGLSAAYIKRIIGEVQEEYGSDFYDKIYLRSEVKRREIVDFTPEFSKHLLLFYMNFGKTLVKPHKETISIFLPTPEDQESQMLIWSIEAIEKFDEKASVPFSGYFNSLLVHRPYDLPEMFLGKELSKFQREKSKVVNAMKKERGGDSESVFSSQEIADRMGMDIDQFSNLEQSHKNWLSSKSATSLTWEENGEEKSSHSVMGISHSPQSGGVVEKEKAHELSTAIIHAAIESGEYEDAFSVISQIDRSDPDLSKIEDLSQDFKIALGQQLGMMSNGTEETAD